jgi:Ribbon-helix-helix protein, copG family
LPDGQEEAWESTDSVRLSIVVGRELAERLAEEAGRREISSSDLIVELVRRGLEESGGARPPGTEA